MRLFGQEGLSAHGFSVAEKLKYLQFWSHAVGDKYYIFSVELVTFAEANIFTAGKRMVERNYGHLCQ